MTNINRNFIVSKEAAMESSIDHLKTFVHDLRSVQIALQEVFRSLPESESKDLLNLAKKRMEFLMTNSNAFLKKKESQS